MKILALAYHTGSGNSVGAICRELFRRGENVIIAAQDRSQAGHAFDNYGLQYSVLDSKEGLVSAITSFRPDVVLTGTSPQCSEGEFVLEQAATQILGTKVVSVIDSPLNYSARFSDYESTNLKYLPDRVAVIGDSCVEKMVEEGIPRGIIVKTGNPHFDHISGKKSPEEVFETKRALEISTEFFVLYGSDYLIRYYGGADKCREEIGYTEHDALNELASRSRDPSNFETFACNGIKIFVKPHPREIKEGDIPKLQEIVEGAPIEFVGHTQEYLENTPEHLNMGRLLAASDLHMASFSSSMFESLLEDPRRPLIAIEPNAKLRHEDDLSLATRFGLTVPVYEKEGLHRAFSNALTENPKEREKKVKNTLSLDGKSAERVVNLIYEVARL